jgi:hypothetical protein
MTMTALVCGCTQVPLPDSGSLVSYADLAPSKSRMTKARYRVDSSVMKSVSSIRIIPTTVLVRQDTSPLGQAQRDLVANALDRALCIDLSSKYRIAGPTESADLTVHATITNLVPTNETAAATSTIASLGASIALPIPVPRLPIGLGGLAVEAEALASDGSQKAAIIWSRGANMFTSKARVSEVGDAYSLATSFSGDFGKMLIEGTDPSAGMPRLPTKENVKAFFGNDPKYAACEVFGVHPGVMGTLAGQLGAPPSWSDQGAATR